MDHVCVLFTIRITSSSAALLNLFGLDPKEDYRMGSIPLIKNICMDQLKNSHEWKSDARIVSRLLINLL